MPFPFFNEDRKESIQSLEFFFFLHDFYFHLLEKTEKTNSKNSAMNEFVDAIKSYYDWQFYKIHNYSASLMDYVFWQYREFYLEQMQKFVSHELTGREFVDHFYFKLLNDRDESNLLKKDFKKQERLELTPKSYQFSKIIDDFYFALEAFDGEPEPGDSSFLTEDQLRQIVKDVLPRVEKYFIEEI